MYKRQITTSPDTSREALRLALDALMPGGLLTAVLYWGHDGGRTEAEAVLAWAEALPTQRFHAQHLRSVNRRRPPTLLAIDVLR